MKDRAPDLDRRETRLPDGRRLIYYPFRETPPTSADAPAPGTPAAPPPPER